MRVDPYLYFEGRCEEALEFYRRAIGAEIAVLNRFGDVPGVPAPAGAEGKVMHASLRVGATTVLASDGQRRGAPAFAGFSLALGAASDAEAERLFAALAEGGTVQMALHANPFASRFGMLADRFGVHWIVTAPQAEAPA